MQILIGNRGENLGKLTFVRMVPFAFFAFLFQQFQGFFSPLCRIIYAAVPVTRTDLVSLGFYWLKI